MRPDTLTGLLPLEPPPAPPDAGPTPWLVATAILLAAAAVAWLWRRSRRPTQRLARLSRRLASGERDAAAAAAELERLLRGTLGRTRLAREAPPSHLPPGDWQALVDGLQAVRFAPGVTDPAALTPLLALARRALQGARHGG